MSYIVEWILITNRIEKTYDALAATFGVIKLTKVDFNSYSGGRSDLTVSAKAGVASANNFIRKKREIKSLTHCLLIDNRGVVVLVEGER